MKFPYCQYRVTPSPTAPGGVLYRPEIPLRLVGGAGSVDLWVLVDAGSDDTLIPISAGNKIKATIDPNQIWKIEGIGGQALTVAPGDVVLEVTDGKQTFRWPAKVGFVDFADPRDEVVLVGHAGFLDYFRVTYDGYQRTVEIDVTAAFSGQVL
jgi:hypothetical protein